MVLNSGRLTGRVRPASSGPGRNYVNLYDFVLGNFLRKNTVVYSLLFCAPWRELERERARNGGSLLPKADEAVFQNFSAPATIKLLSALGKVNLYFFPFSSKVGILDDDEEKVFKLSFQGKFRKSRDGWTVDAIEVKTEFFLLHKKKNFTPKQSKYKIFVHK